MLHRKSGNKHVAKPAYKQLATQQSLVCHGVTELCHVTFAVIRVLGQIRIHSIHNILLPSSPLGAQPSSHTSETPCRTPVILLKFRHCTSDLHKPMQRSPSLAAFGVSFFLLRIRWYAKSKFQLALEDHSAC